MGWINDKGSLPKFEQGGKVSRFEENQKKSLQMKYNPPK